MHMENPIALANTIINDIYDLNLPVDPNPLNPLELDDEDEDFPE